MSFNRSPGEQATSRPADRETNRPGDQQTRGPGDQETRGPGDHKNKKYQKTNAKKIGPPKEQHLTSSPRLDMPKSVLSWPAVAEKTNLPAVRGLTQS